MRHHNSVFHDLLKHVPWAVFDRLVEEHGADKHVRRLSTKSQFLALLYGQLAGAVSLREIAAGLESHAGPALSSRCQASLALDACRCQCAPPGAVFAGLFAALVAQAERGLRRAIGEAVHLIDATGCA